MFWLALGTILLLWSAFTAPSKRLDRLAVLCLLLLVGLTFGAVRVYHARTEGAALIGGTLIAALLLWLFGSQRRSWARWAALLCGLAAGLFSIFGPAQGLFP